MSAEEAARRDIVEIAHRLHTRGWVANHDGNASIRLEAGRILATPTAVSKGEVSPESLIIVDETGKKLEGTRRSFSEFTLHGAAYGLRPDIGAVLHAHPPAASAFAVSGVSLDPPFMPEAVVSLGPTIPTSAFALPYGEAGAAPLKAHLPYVDALLMAGNGVLTVGPDLWTAFYRMELVEHLARIKLAATQLGGPTALSAEIIETLVAKRTKGGLGPQARGVTPPWATEAAPTGRAQGPCTGKTVSASASPSPSVGAGLGDADIEALVAAEIARVLAGQG